MSSAMVFSGKAGVDTYVAVTLKSAIRLYAKTGMKVNRAYTPTAMLAKAGEITGKKFKRGQFAEAVNELEIWLAKNGRASDPA